MKSNVNYILLMAALIVIQVLVIDHIEVTGVMNPFVYVYPLLILPPKVNRIALMLIGCGMGVVVDALSGTWGIHIAAMVLTGYVRPYVFGLCASQEDVEKPNIAYHYMPSTFVKYASILVVIHHLCLFTLEAFGFDHYWFVVVKTVVSSLVSLALIYVLERIRTINIEAQKHR